MQEPHQEQLQSQINLYTQRSVSRGSNSSLTITKKFPNSVVLHNIVGATNQSLGNLDKAIQAYKKAISIKPDYADAYYNIDNVLKTQGNLDEAIKLTYQEALSIKLKYA